jgi:hypothetical protein
MEASPIPTNIKNLYNKIQKTITGRYAMWPQDALAWYQINYKSSGPTLEIGTAFGGSAIVARKAKDDAGKFDTIYCIDPLDGYYGPRRPDVMAGVTPTPSMVEKNFEMMEVKNIQLILHQTPPLPKELGWIRFGAVLIDGNHKGSGPTDDWNIVKDIVNPGGFVFFHDVHYEDVQRAVKIADSSHGWKLIARYMKKGTGMPSQMQVEGNEAFGSHAILQKL